MDSKFFAMNEKSKSLEEALGGMLNQMEQEDIQDVIKMNRAQRRAWAKQFRRRGRGYTR